MLLLYALPGLACIIANFFSMLDVIIYVPGHVPRPGNSKMDKDKKDSDIPPFKKTGFGSSPK